MNESVWELAISLAAIVAVVWLFLGYSKHYGAENQKARILYISGYAVLIIIELVVYICLNNFQKADVMSTVSFGATLSSLIMSVVAIIFTIVSGKDGREQLGRINEATDQLQQTAATLGTFQVIADHIDDRLDEMYNKVCGLESGQRTTMSRLESMIKRNSIVQSGQEGVRPSNVFDLDQFMNSISPLGVLTLITCQLSAKHNKQVNFRKFGPMFDPENLDYVNGFLMACICIGLIGVEGKWPDYTVESIDEELGEKATTRWTEILLEIRERKFKLLVVESYNAVLSYFGEPEYVEPIEESE